MTFEVNQIIADAVESVGLTAESQIIRNCLYSQFLDERIYVYGPSYIWTGTLVGVSVDCIAIDDVYQIYETGSHDDESCERERISERMIIPKSAICNVGIAKWS